MPVTILSDLQKVLKSIIHPFISQEHRFLRSQGYKMTENF